MTDEKLMMLLHEFKQLGATSMGGVTRCVYDDNWSRAQKKYVKVANYYGLYCFCDKMGTIYAATTDDISDKSVILTGSHIDTVINGGWLDGIYGVLSSVLAVGQLFQKFGTPKIPLCAVSFSEEEGSRFDATFTGSRYLTHQLDDAVFDLKDTLGLTFNQERQHRVNELKSSIPIGTLDFKIQSYIELHIEQGDILDQSYANIAVVTDIVGQKRLLITIKGISNHAGTTQMSGRVDALKNAVCLMNQIYLSLGRMVGLRFTMGKMTVLPNVANVIPREVEISLDMRHKDQSVLNHAFEQATHLIDSAHGTYHLTTNVVATPMDYQLQQRVISSIQQEKMVAKLVFSGAGHDAQVMACSNVPSAMIFVPSKNGVSHVPQENTADSDLLSGQRVLQRLLYNLAYHN
ncbi:hydantoinase/carbamoylase family amidase [Leuconostoc gelidum]|uniref:hydantoinase/carbamoylase family amidase n=1 Tax=Leuconostoc gelidum TaxID=1244 RepID=UPI001C7DF5D8|nr:hydantoinase/carbamoylase family amidase [Leuconostoc gelidum]MBZ6010123.1 hydantoinase/carbamoylase family amidase [Leuconostoc gelidum subsp. aenigmaticum]